MRVDRQLSTAQLQVSLLAHHIQAPDKTVAHEAYGLWRVQGRDHGEEFRNSRINQHMTLNELPYLMELTALKQKQQQKSSDF